MTGPAPTAAAGSGEASTSQVVAGAAGPRHPGTVTAIATPDKEQAMAAAGYTITTAWVSQGPHDPPWLVAAYDQATEDAHNGTPAFFTDAIDKAAGPNDKVRIIDIHVDHDAIEERFRNGQVAGTLGADA